MCGQDFVYAGWYFRHIQYDHPWYDVYGDDMNLAEYLARDPDLPPPVCAPAALPTNRL